MFENLTDKLREIFRRLASKGALSTGDVDAALRQVRLALLEADVNYEVAKDFVARVRERAVGAKVMRSLTPAQQVVKIVNEELVKTLGPPAKIDLAGSPPHVIMLVGLQGSGKTTTAAKLALKLRQRGQRPLLVAADPYRPAAAAQLEVLGEKLDIPVHSGDADPPALCAESLSRARDSAYSVVILDTAGRWHIDEEMMGELGRVKAAVKPQEVLLVADAMTGQEAMRVAEEFDRRVGLTGLILTKMEGDARGGAAISMRQVSGVPIKFIGVGEKLHALEPFHPDRLASRILGMGDILTLIEKAEAAFERERAMATVERLVKGQFDLEDFLGQLRQVKRMGPISQWLDMVPGFSIGRGLSPELTERQLKRVEAIINSMTLEERSNPGIINASRKRRIARGSGTTVQEVNQLLAQFRRIKRMMKQLTSGGMDLLSMFEG